VLPVFANAAAMVAALAREVLWMKVRLERLSLLMAFLIILSTNSLKLAGLVQAGIRRK
jgi:hypothetical protein